MRGVAATPGKRATQVLNANDDKKRRDNLSDWIEANVCLPDTVAEPGPIRLAPYMRAIADAIGDPAVERVSVLKSARIGYTTVLTAAIGYHVIADPAPILCLLPTEADCRDYLVSDIESCEFHRQGAAWMRFRMSCPAACANAR